MEHWGLRSSWVLHSVCWQSWIKQSKGSFTPGLTGCLKTAVTNYQLPNYHPRRAKTSLFIILIQSLINSTKIIITHVQKLVCYLWPSPDVQRNCFMLLLIWCITWHDALATFFTLKKKFLHRNLCLAAVAPPPPKTKKEWMHEWMNEWQAERQDKNMQLLCQFHEITWNSLH